MKNTPLPTEPQEQKCPNEANHTPAPTDPMGWDAWAEQKVKTHIQTKCDGCGLFKIWVPRH